MTFLWQPGGLPPLRVRRNPQASLYQPVLDPDDWGYDNTLTPNGVATLGETALTAEGAIAALHKAGTRGATALGVGAGFLLSSNHLRGALLGGLLGYFGGKLIVAVADKALAAASAVRTIDQKVEKATS